MAKKNWFEKLASLEGAQVEEYNPYLHVVRTPSPSVNFVLGNTHGLPQGFSMVLWGPPKAGKSVLVNATIGQLHKDDPEAIVVKFDTEMRENGQLTPSQAKLWGIDRSRYICYSVNTPELVYDRISNDIEALCQEGAPIKLIVIDSMNAIRGRRSLNSTTIMTQQIGDDALTNKNGLKQILATQRRHKIALIMTTHVAAELDMHEQMRGNKVKMATAFGVQHHAEYFLYVESLRTKDGKTTLLGEKLEDENLKDMGGKAEQTAHKIRVIMKDSSMGPKGRTGVFTLDYHRGIVNTHEEVFELGHGRGIIERPNNRIYAFDGKQWDGKEAMLSELAGNPELCEKIITELRRRDAIGLIPKIDTEE